ncbi:MAG TPA: hypothetical protein VLI54_07275 [Bacillota bacterium]|nr:hypothetical protein [Bacillota bacterium]
MAASDAFEIWEDPSGHARFYFSHTGTDFTTGTLVLLPDSELPRHNRELAFENLVQVAGTCQLSLTNEDGEIEATYDLRPGTSIRMKKGQWHIHANPYEEESVTLFKAVGDITEIVETMRHKYTKVEPIDTTAE